jgi:hypothetical protein
VSVTGNLVNSGPETPHAIAKIGLTGDGVSLYIESLFQPPTERRTRSAGSAESCLRNSVVRFPDFGLCELEQTYRWSVEQSVSPSTAYHPIRYAVIAGIANSDIRRTRRGWLPLALPMN